MAEFQVRHNERGYTVLGHEGVSLETVWLSQKCWFMPGSEVEITDSEGNSTVFIRE